jgi:NhaP-type Na+/H+ or K+/H+ antiporter
MRTFTEALLILAFGIAVGLAFGWAVHIAAERADKQYQVQQP